jgi:NADH dehydrogenase FAD-containing subunit
LAFSDKKYAEKAWVDYKHVKILQRPDVEFVHGSVVKVDPETQTATIKEFGKDAERSEKYDFFIGATGLRRKFPVVPQSFTKKEYLEETGKHIDAVLNGTDPVLVVGGGT